MLVRVQKINSRANLKAAEDWILTPTGAARQLNGRLPQYELDQRMIIGRRVALPTVLALLSVVTQQAVGQLPAQQLPAQLDARVARAVAGEPFGIFSV